MVKLYLKPWWNLPPDMFIKIFVITASLGRTYIVFRFVISFDKILRKFWNASSGFFFYELVLILNHPLFCHTAVYIYIYIIYIYIIYNIYNIYIYIYIYIRDIQLYSHKMSNIWTQWTIVSDLNMSHGKLSNFTLVIKLRNFDFESH